VSIGAGLSGGYARETGGGAGAQFAASVLGGVAAPGALAAGMKAASKGAAMARPLTPKQINAAIEDALKDSKVRLQDIPIDVVSTLQDDIAKASQHGELSKEALSRLADYRLSGATPARGNLTLTPADITQQKNLAKFGINSRNPAMHVLANRQNENIGEFINRLNELGGGAQVGSRPGMKLIKAVETPIEKARGKIGEAYDAAKTSEGLSAKIDHEAFTSRAESLLKQDIAEEFLPPGIASSARDTVSTSSCFWLASSTG